MAPCHEAHLHISDRTKFAKALASRDYHPSASKSIAAAITQPAPAASSHRPIQTGNQSGPK